MADIISERATITEVRLSDGRVGLKVENVLYIGYTYTDLLDAWDHWHTHVMEPRKERQGGESGTIEG